jgi:N-acetylmuramoyl-L-alanine amidase
MLAIAYYILKVIICSGILYAYYRIALHNKIFHRWNRFYLLAAVVMSLSFPLIKINVWHNLSTDDGQVIKLLTVVTTGDEMVFEASRNGNFHLTGEQGVLLAYILVSLVFLIILMKTLANLNKLVRQHHVQKIQQINFVDTEAKGTPFSFFRYIFWNHHIDINSATGKKIFLHELAHVKEKHSADRLFMNIVLIFFWCNPFFWLIRREMNMIHEFIADSKAVEDNDTSAFAAMILQAAYPQQAFGLTSNFFNSSIKRRLLMLTKMKNARVSYIGRVLALPLLTFIFLAFTVKTKQNISSGEIIGITTLEKTFTVVIDAGHGGNDDGVRATDGTTEKMLDLSIAQKIKQLNSNSNIRILLSRETDILQPVQEKVTWALKQKPDAFISIHINAAPETGVNRSGFELLISRKGNGYEQKARLLGSLISREIGKTYPVAPDLKQRNEKGVWILDAPKISYPALLIHCGYITNKKDLTFIKKESNQEKIAKDILSAIEKYAKAAENMIGITFQDSNDPNKIRNDTIRFAAAPAKNNSKNSSQNANEIVFKAVSLTQLIDTTPQNVKSVDLTTDGNVIIIYNDGKAEKITRAVAEKRGIVVSPPANITLRGASADSAIIFIDGIETPGNSINTINPGDIEGINVLKGFQAIDKYGFKGKNGIIEITMKKDKVVSYTDQYANRDNKKYAADQYTNRDSKKNDLAEIVVTAIQANSQNNIYEDVEIKAAFPGGEGAWTKYVSRAINKNIDDLLKAGNIGTCTVQFIVDKEGTVSDVRALTMEGTRLAEIVINAIKNGPKWIPAVKNGTSVRSYRKQPVTFQVSK